MLATKLWSSRPRGLMPHTEPETLSLKSEVNKVNITAVARHCTAETSTGDKKSSRGVTIQKLHLLPTEIISAFCIDLTRNRNYFSMQHQLNGSYNRNAVFTARYELNL
jgi:hypothetical protein